METKKHPVEIIQMLRDYLQMQDDNGIYNIPYIIELADNYLRNYHCCAFCEHQHGHDNCPETVYDSYTNYHCGHYIDKRTGHNPDYYTEEEWLKIMNKTYNKEKQ